MIFVVVGCGLLLEKELEILEEEKLVYEEETEEKKAKQSSYCKLM